MNSSPLNQSRLFTVPGRPDAPGKRANYEQDRICVSGAALLAASTAAIAQQTEEGAGSHIDNVGGHTDIGPPPSRAFRAAFARRDRRHGRTDVQGRPTATATAPSRLAEFNGDQSPRARTRSSPNASQRMDTDRNQIAQRWPNSRPVAAFDGLGRACRTGWTSPQDRHGPRGSLPLDYGRRDDIRLLSLVVEPLSATTIVEANADYDAGTTLAELLSYEFIAFDKIDVNADGWLTWDETEHLMPRDGTTNPGAQEE